MFVLPAQAGIQNIFSELKKNPSALIDQAEGEPIVILNHNKPTAYLVPAETYEKLMEKIDKLAQERTRTH